MRDITLKVEEPIGATVVHRDAPDLDMTRDSGQRAADHREWLVAELPSAIDQLYEKIGMTPRPGDLDAVIRSLPPGGIPWTPAAIVSAVKDALAAADTVRQLADLLGGGRSSARRANVPSGLLALHSMLPGEVKAKLDLLGRQNGEIAKLARVAQVANDLIPATMGNADGDIVSVDIPLAELPTLLREFVNAVTVEDDERGRIIDGVKAALGLRVSDRDDLADDLVPALVRSRLEGDDSTEQLFGRTLTDVLISFGLNPLMDEESVVDALREKAAHDTDAAVKAALAEFGRRIMIVAGAEEDIDFPTSEVEMSAFIAQAVKPPVCSAHGTMACAWCSQTIPGGLDDDGGCTDCGTFGAYGMHWDTCRNRMRSAPHYDIDEVTALRKFAADTVLRLDGDAETDDLRHGRLSGEQVMALLSDADVAVRDTVTRHQRVLGHLDAVRRVIEDPDVADEHVADSVKHRLEQARRDSRPGEAFLRGEDGKTVKFTMPFVSDEDARRIAEQFASSMAKVDEHIASVLRSVSKPKDGE
jgi:hypothetical protein